MLSFVNDYSEGADERILQRLLETNREQLPGYGEDRYCLSAREKIRSACGCPDADIYFLTGGTQTNKIVISSLLAPWQGVVAAESGHIGTHEAGAIENAGHKVLTLPHREGKLMPDTLAQYLRSFYAMKITATWYFPAWYIFPGRQSTAHCIPAGNWQICMISAGNIRFPSISTAQGFATVCPAPPAI